MDLKEMTKDELEILENKKEAELRQIIESNETITLQLLDLRKQVTEIELRMAPLKSAKAQGSFNKQRIDSELREIKTNIYQRLRGL